MADIAELLAQAESSNKKDRQKAVKEMSKLDKQYDPVMDMLNKLVNDDPDKKVRSEAQKALASLSNKPVEEPVASEEVEVDSLDELEEGEYDVDSNLDKAEEDRREAQAAGKGLRVILQENNYVVMDNYGNVVSSEASKGTITVANTGIKDRITGVDLLLKEIDNLKVDGELSEANNIGLLKPGMDNAWKVDYEFEKELSPIKIEQKYVDPSTGLSPNFIGDESKDFEAIITVTNTSDNPIQNIVGDKTINSIATLSNSSASKGSVNHSEGMIKFNIDELGPGESAIITVNLAASLPEDMPAYTAGELKISYENQDKLASGLQFESVDGVSSISQKVKRKQREEEPGFYNCEIIFENRSEFIYDLHKFSVFAGNFESSELVLDWDGSQVSEDEREIVPGEAVNYQFVFESAEGTPTFGEHVEFTVQHEIQKSTVTHISIPAEELKFMAIDIVKNFMLEGNAVNRFEVPSYVETEVPTIITVKGIGTYPLEGLVIKDTIPEGFKPPTEDQVIVSRAENDLAAEEYSVTISGSEGGTHEVVVTLEHLEETNAGGLKQDDEITVKYLQIADNPKQMEDSIQTTSSVEGFIYISPDARVVSESTNDDLELVVIHVRDDIDIGKSFESIDYEGMDAYLIRLEAENFGSSTIDVEIEDLVPNGFKFVEGSMKTEPEAEKMDPKSHSEGTIYGVKFSAVKPENTVWATYVVTEESKDANPRKLSSLYKG